MTSSLSHIIDGLTEAQKRVLAQMPGKFGNGRGMAGRSLAAKGLVKPHPRFCFQWVLTPLGLAIRFALQASSKASDGEGGE